MASAETLIVHLNGEKIILDCLKSIYEDNSSAVVRLLFNNSTDQSYNKVKKQFPQVISYTTQETWGFAKAANYLVKKSTAPLVVLLNNDTIVEKRWLNELIRTKKRYSRCVAVQPKIKSMRRKTAFEYAGAAGGYIDCYGYPFCRGRIFETVEEDNHQYEDESVIFWGCGSCLLIDRAFFVNSGGFDEELFMYVEEIDFAFRVALQGKEIRFCPKSEVYHLGSFSIKNQRLSTMKERLITRNHLIAFFKNYPLGLLLRFTPGRIILELLAALRFPLRRGVSLLVSLPQVLTYFIFRGGIVKRKEVTRKKKITNREFLLKLFPHSIALAYYINNVKTFKQLRW
jgi:GT2 family glycosyltransferase